LSQYQWVKFLKKILLSGFLILEEILFNNNKINLDKMIIKSFPYKSGNDSVVEAELTNQYNPCYFTTLQPFNTGFFNYSVPSNLDLSSMNLNKGNSGNDLSNTFNMDSFWSCDLNTYMPSYTPQVNQGFYGLQPAYQPFPFTLNQVSMSPKMRNMEDPPVQKRKFKALKDFVLPWVLRDHAING